MVVFRQSGCIGAKVVLVGRVVAFGGGCINAKVVVIGKNGVNREKVVVIGQKWL